MEAIGALLDGMHQTTDEGVRAAATRIDHMRWVAMAAMVSELEDALADDSLSVRA